MKKITKLVGGLLLCAVSVIANAAPLALSTAKEVLFVNETVSTTGSLAISARSGPLTNSDTGFGIDRLGTKLPPNRVPVSIPPISYGSGYSTTTRLPTKGDVLSIATSRIKQHFPILKNSLSAYMQQYGLSSTWFNYRQDVQLDVGGVAQTWTVSWDFFTDAAGRGAYADPQLVSPDPRILYVTYTSLAADDNLPQGWAYDGGGKLQWQLRNLQFEPVTSFQTIDVAGAFDSAQSDSEEQDNGINCLMDNANSGCNPSLISIKSLLDQTGAMLAVVDYTRRVAPVYQENADGTQSPVMALSLDKRTLQYRGCGDVTYENIGRYGFELSASVGRYLAVSSGEPRVVSFGLVQQFDGSYLSPTASYDWSVKMPRPQAARITPYSIEPMKGQTLMLTSDIPGLQYTAPIEYTGDTSPELGTFQSASYYYTFGKSDEFKIQYVGRCAEAGGYEIATTFMQNHLKTGWQYIGETVSPVSTSGWSPVALYGHGEARYYAYADEASGILRITEGVQSSCYFICNNGYPRNHNLISMRKQPPLPSGSTSGSTSGTNWVMNSIWDLFYSASYYDVWQCGTASKPWTYDTPPATAFTGFFGGVQNSMSWSPAPALRYNQFCTGYLWFRGFDINTRAPYFEGEEKFSRIDPSLPTSTDCFYNDLNEAWTPGGSYGNIPYLNNGCSGTGTTGDQWSNG